MEKVSMMEKISMISQYQMKLESMTKLKIFNQEKVKILPLAVYLILIIIKITTRQLHVIYQNKKC